VRGDKLVLTKLRLPQLGEELSSLFREIDDLYTGRGDPPSGKYWKQFV
jgi:hypothetical protein